MAIQIDGDSGISGVNGSATTPALQGTDSNTGIVFGTDTVQIATGGSTRATVDSSGRLGINTTSLVSKFTIDNGGRADPSSTGSTTQSNAALEINADSESNTRLMAGMSTGSKFWMQVQNNVGDTADDILLNPIGGNVGINNSAPNEKLHVGGKIQFGGNTSYYGVVEHEEGVTGANIYTSKDTGGHIVKCGLTPTERLRITQDGKIRIGMSDFGNDPSASNAGVMLKNTSVGAFNSAASVTTGSSHAVFLNPNGVCGTINTSGSATSYNESSDYRLKENVVELNGAITRVKQLAPKRFNFISEADTTVDGFLAHEVQTVVPEAVTGTHNGIEVWKQGEELPDGVSVGDNKLDDDGNTIPDYQGIDKSKLVPLLTAALQEAISKIETLETQNADLLARVTALEAA